MRWDRLLADIEAAELARERAEMLGEAAERSRLETARVRLQSRLEAACGAQITVEIDGPHRAIGAIEAVGNGWFVLVGGAQSWVIPTGHVLWIGDLPRHAAPPPEGGAKRIFESLGLQHVLRGIAADRSFVQIGLGAADAVAGTIDRVGADFIDVAVHATGEPRRAREVRGQRTVRLDAISYLRRGAA